MYLMKNSKKPKSRKQMVTYLAVHPRYHSMNVWNESTSYAHCIKTYRLGLDEEALRAVLEMLEVPEAFEAFSKILQQFEQRHKHRWQIWQNGRSGGYLVLIQGGVGTDGRLFTWPGKSLDMNAEFSSWSADELAERTDLVWDFDETCEAAVAAFVDFAKRHRAEEKEVLVPRKIRVAVPRD